MEYQIVNEYMMRKYPNRLYSMAKGNDCTWVMVENINMYFTIKDNKIMRIDID